MLLCAGFALGVLPWVVANPPAAAPDEPSHYVKAVAAGRGDLLGIPGPFDNMGNFNADQRRQVDRTFRAFSVPPALRYQTSLPCVAFRPDATADCLAADEPLAAVDPAQSIVGSYQPFVYVPPGLLMRLANDRLTAVLLGRAGTAALSVSLLMMAVWLLWGAAPAGRSFTMLGFVLGVTPMVVFMASEIGGSGPEIAGAVAVTAGVIRLSRSDSDSPPTRSVWALVGLAGLLLGLSRPLAPLWLALEAVLLVALVGVRRVWSLVRAGGRWAVFALIVPAVGVAANVAWGTAIGLRAPVLWSRFPSSARKGAGRLERSAVEVIGSFGWQDTDMPAPSYILWFTLLALLVALALAVGGLRQRLVLMGTAGGVVASSLFVGALLAQNDQSLLGRYILPVAVMLPLVAGEIIARNPLPSLQRAARLVVVPVASSVAALQLLAWVANSRRYAVGHRGPWWFVPDARWSPPGGWWPWLLVAVVAAVLQGLSAVLAGRPTVDARASDGAAAVVEAS